MAETIKGNKKVLSSLTAFVMALSYVVTPLSAFAETKDTKNVGSGDSCIEGGTVKVSATDENNKPLSDVTYKLKNASGTVVDTKTTADNGFIYFTLKGTEKYTVTGESNEPKYDKSTMNKEITLKSGVYKQQDFEVSEQYNFIKRNITVSTKDNIDGTTNSHPNVPFKLTKQNGEVVKEGNTDSNGVFEVRDVPYGDYVLNMGNFEHIEPEFKLYEKGSSSAIKTFSKNISIRKTTSNVEYYLESRPHIVNYTVDITKIESDGSVGGNIPYQLLLKKKTTGDVVKLVDSVDNVATLDKIKYGNYTVDVKFLNDVEKGYTFTSKYGDAKIQAPLSKDINISETSSNSSDSYYLRKDFRTATITPEILKLDGTKVAVADGESIISVDGYSDVVVKNGKVTLDKLLFSETLSASINKTKVKGVDGVTYNVGKRTSTESSGIIYNPYGQIISEDLKNGNYTGNYTMYGTPENYKTVKMDIRLGEHKLQKSYPEADYYYKNTPIIKKSLNLQNDNVDYEFIFRNKTTSKSIYVSDKTGNFMVGNFIQIPEGDYNVLYKKLDSQADYKYLSEIGTEIYTSSFGVKYKTSVKKTKEIPDTPYAKGFYAFPDLNVTGSKIINYSMDIYKENIQKPYSSSAVIGLGTRDMYGTLITKDTSNVVRHYAMSSTKEPYRDIGGYKRNTDGMMPSIKFSGIRNDVISAVTGGFQLLQLDTMYNGVVEGNQVDINTMINKERVVYGKNKVGKVEISGFKPNLFEYRIAGRKLDFTNNLDGSVSLTPSSLEYIKNFYEKNSLMMDRGYFEGTPSDLLKLSAIELPSLDVQDLYKEHNSPSELEKYLNHFSVKDTNVEVFDKNFETENLTKIEGNSTNNFYTSERGKFGKTDKLYGNNPTTTRTTNIISTAVKENSPSNINLYDIVVGEDKYSNYYSYLETYLYGNSTLNNGKKINEYKTIKIENQYLIGGKYVTVAQIEKEILGIEDSWVKTTSSSAGTRYENIYAYRTLAEAKENPLKQKIVITLTTVPDTSGNTARGKVGGELLPKPEPKLKAYNFYEQVKPTVYKENQQGEYIKQDTTESNRIVKPLEFRIGTKTTGINTYEVNTVNTLEVNPSLLTTVKMLNPNKEWKYELDGQTLNLANSYAYNNIETNKVRNGSMKTYNLNVKIPYATEGGSSGSDIVKPVVDFTDCNAIPTFSKDKNNQTNTDVLLTINYSKFAKNKEYKIGENGEWLNYTKPISIQKNTTVYAKSFVEDTIETLESNIVITNIDKVKPTLTLTANKTEPTNTNVLVTVLGNDDIAVKHIYWKEGTSTEDEVIARGTKLIGENIEVEANKTITVVVEDTAGNKTLKEITITNIDKEAPTTPVLTPDNTELTTKDVKVTVDYSKDSVKKYYKINGGNWLEYVSEITVSENSIIYAKSEDNAGNVSEEGILEIKNIDKSVPNAPTITLDKEELTNDKVTVSITDENSNEIFYKIGNVEEWIKYTVPFEVNKNVEIFAKTKGKNGNESLEIIKEIVNIDKVKPVINAEILPTVLTNKDVTVNINVTDNKEIKEVKYLEGTHTVEEVLATGTIIANTDSIIITENKEIKIATIDKAGNTEFKVITIDNIDRVAPELTATLSTNEITNQPLDIIVVTHDDRELETVKYVEGEATEKEVLDNGTALTGNKISVSKDGKFTIVSKDKAGNTTLKVIEVTNIDTVKPEIKATVKGEVTNSDIEINVVTTDNKGLEVIKYAKGDLEANDVLSTGTEINATDKITVSENGKYTIVAKDNAGNITKEVIEINQIDKIKPTISYTTNEDKITNQDVVVTLDVKDNVSVKEVKYLDGEKTLEEVIAEGTSVSATENIAFTENKTITVVAKDTANNTTLKVIKVEKIDKLAPIIITKHSTELSNLSKELEIEVNDNVSVKIVKYLEGNKTKEEVMAEGKTITSPTTLTVENNETYTIVATDTAGNTTIKVVEVGNIDKEKPVIVTEIGEATNQDSEILVSVTDNVAVKEVKYLEGEKTLEEVVANGNLLENPYTIAVSENGTYTIVATDTAGNTEIKVVTISNIDKEKPVIKVTVSTSNPTNKDITIETLVTDNVAVKEVKYLEGEKEISEVLADGKVLGTTDTITVKENGIYTIVAIDNVGNTEIKKVTITNIDKVKPTIESTFTSDNTNKDIAITVTAKDNKEVQSFKYLNGNKTVEEVLSSGNDLGLEDVIIVTENGTITLSVIDTAGNTEIKVIEISNIDKVKPTIEATFENKVTNKDVVVSVKGEDNVEVKDFKYLNGNKSLEEVLTDGKTLNTEDEIVVTENGTITIVISDKVGNTEIKVIEISNIDKVKPEIEATFETKATNKDVVVTVKGKDNVEVKDFKYLLGEKSLEEVLTDGKPLNKEGEIVLTENGKITIVITDTAGNTEIKVIEVTNMDNIKPTIAVTIDNTLTNKETIVKVVADDNVEVKEFKYLLGENTLEEVLSSGKTLNKEDEITVTENSKITIVAVDTAGNTEIKVIEVSNIDKVKPEIEATFDTKVTNKEVTVNVTATDNVEVKTVKYLEGNKTVEEVNKDGKTLETTDTITVTENTEITIVVTDTTGNTEIKVIEITNIDKVNPEIEYSLSTTKPTNKDVVVTVKATDNVKVSEFKYLAGDKTLEEVLENGKDLAKEDTITMNVNGKITLVTVDTAGNTSLKVVEVDNITTEKSVINVDLSTENPTNKDVTLSVEVQDTVSVNVVKYSEGKVTPEEVLANGTEISTTDTINVESNKVITIVAENEAGNISVKEVVISNIDKENPEIKSTLSTEEETNKNVVVSVEVTDNVKVQEVKYLEGNKTLEEVMESGKDLTSPYEITVTENKEITLVVTDNADNKTLKVIEITNINKEEITEPTINVLDTKPTNKDVAVTIDYPTNSVKNEYKVGENGEWKEYEGEFKVSENTTVYAKATDKFGVETNVVEVEIKNIVKENNSVTKITVDKSTPTNKDVTVTIESDIKEGKILYTENGKDWKEYKEPFKVSENKTITALTEDIAGNKSETTIYNITNIDKEAPELDLTVSNDQPTNQTITLTVMAKDNVKVDTVYILEGKNSIEETIAKGKVIPNGSVIEVPENITYTIVAVDTANNQTGKTIEITNIDKEAPESPIIHADKTEITKKNVRITIDYPAKAFKKFYSINGSEWKEYTEPFEVEENAVVTAYGIDKVGNESGTTNYNVVNIDKELPTFEMNISNENPTNQDITICGVGNDNVEIDKILYAKDKKAMTIEEVKSKGQELKECVVISENGTYNFVVIDKAGNELLVTKEITNINKEEVKSPIISFTDKKDNGKVCSYVVNIKYPTDSVKKEYKVGKDGQWKLYKKPFKVNCGTEIFTRATNEYGTVSETEVKKTPTATYKEPSKPSIDKPTTDKTDKPVINKPIVEEPQDNTNNKVDVNKPVNDSDNANEELPKTGSESNNTTLYGSVLLVLGSIILFLTRRKQATK